MKNPIQKLRRFFVRPRTFNATAARAATQPQVADDEGDGTRLSGAFIIVLVLHVIAVMGVFAFARIKEASKDSAAKASATQTVAPKSALPKPPAAKPPAVKPPAPAPVASVAPVTLPVATHDSPKPPVAAAHTVHVVKENETLTKIAVAFSVGVPDLVSTNKLKSQDDIHVGQVLTIPSTKVAPKTPAPAESRTPKTYIVRKGDSPMKIAREHGCTYEELMKLNSIKDPKKIQTGQVLKLPVKNG